MPPPQDVQVTLTPIMSGSSFTNWQMTIDGKTQQPGSYPAIDVGNGNSADFKITIQNPPGQNISFASFLVPAENKDIHKVDGINTAILTFKDHNWNKGPVPYEILFTGAAKLDPIIINNGGGPPFYMNYAIDGLALLAALVVGYVIAQARFRRRRV
jgi:hypothetical protein